MKKKTDFVSILVYLAMIGLLAIIILPPVLRVWMPTNTPVMEPPKDKVEALVCHKQLEVETVPVTVKATTNYKNDQLVRLTLLYQTTKPATALPTLEEVTTFLNIPNIKKEETEGQIKFDIPRSLLETNKEDLLLQKYYQPLEEQAVFYQDQGFTCQVIS